MSLENWRTISLVVIWQDEEGIFEWVKITRNRIKPIIVKERYAIKRSSKYWRTTNAPNNTFIFSSTPREKEHKRSKYYPKTNVPYLCKPA